MLVYIEEAGVDAPVVKARQSPAFTAVNQTLNVDCLRRL